MLVAPAIGTVSLFFASIFTSNILLSNFLGMCSFIVISRDFKSSFGLGFAVTVVLTITTMLNWFIYYYILVPFELEYLRFIIFILVIAAVVQILEMFIDRVSQALYMTLGIFLPLITVNCSILGAALFMQIRSYNLAQTLVFSVGSGLGWWLAILALAAMRKHKIEKAPIPEGLKGAGIIFITIGLMAMAFTGFSGMLTVQ